MDTSGYVPSGTWSGSPEWKILDGPSVRELGRFRPHHSGGGHNAVASLDGTRLFCASKANCFLAVVATATGQVVREIGPVGGGIYPFTVNAAGTRCYLNTGRAGVASRSAICGRARSSTGPRSPAWKSRNACVTASP